MLEDSYELLAKQDKRNREGLIEIGVLLEKVTIEDMKDKESACPIFRALENKGLRWNPETEEIEEAKEQRWRARFCEIYFIIDSDGLVCPSKDAYTKYDNMYWESGNYFRTTDEAKKYADEFKRILKGRTLDNEV